MPLALAEHGNAKLDPYSTLLHDRNLKPQTDPGGPIPPKFDVLFRLGVNVPDLFTFMLYPKQGLSLRSDERLTPPPLTARAPVRNERAKKGLLLSFKHKTARKNGEGETVVTNTQDHVTWGELLRSAVHAPRKLLAPYTALHDYSFGNNQRGIRERNI